MTSVFGWWNQDLKPLMQIQNSVLWQIWKWNPGRIDFNSYYFPKPSSPPLKGLFIHQRHIILCFYSIPGILSVTRGTKMFKINTLSANSLQPINRKKKPLVKPLHWLSYSYIRNNNVPNSWKSMFLTYNLIQILIQKYVSMWMSLDINPMLI